MYVVKVLLREFTGHDHDIGLMDRNKKAAVVREVNHLVHKV